MSFYKIDLGDRSNRPDDLAESRNLCPLARGSNTSHFEVTFLGRDRFPNGADMAHLPVSSPHPKNITNVYYKAPLYLDLAWSDGRRNTPSQLYTLQGWFKFFQSHHQQHNLGKLLTAMMKMSLKKMLP